MAIARDRRAFPSLEVPEYFVKDLQEGLGAVLAASR
jgi:epoxide hydrolase